MANVKFRTSENTAFESNGEGKGNTQLEKYFIDSLKDIYWAEEQLAEALPKWQDAATTEELRSAVAEHIAQTEEHITRLEEVFELFGKPAEAKKCEAMEGLIKEGQQAIASTAEGSMTRDAAIIVAAQKVEHYEIATYGSLIQLAKTIGNNEAAGTLKLTLDEEKQTDQALTELAKYGINWEAEQEAATKAQERTQ